MKDLYYEIVYNGDDPNRVNFKIYTSKGICCSTQRCNILNIGVIREIFEEKYGIKCDSFRVLLENISDNVNLQPIIDQLPDGMIFEFEDANNRQIINAIKGNNFRPATRFMDKYNNSNKGIEKDNMLSYLEEMELIKETVSKFNLSDMEKLMFIYDIVRNKIYKEVAVDENANKSRDLAYVINSEQVVCLGFANYFASLANLLGVYTEVRDYEDENGVLVHSTVVSYVNDAEYGIKGIFEFDPTNESRRNKNNRSFLKKYSRFAMPVALDKVSRTSSQMLLFEIVKKYNKLSNLSSVILLGSVVKQSFDNFMVVAQKYFNVTKNQQGKSQIYEIVANGSVDLEKVNKLVEDNGFKIVNGELKCSQLKLTISDFVQILYNARSAAATINSSLYSFSGNELIAIIQSAYKNADISEILTSLGEISKKTENSDFKSKG